jgi:D-glycero-alpha-D-manno-heptose-7-phosphate kinase
MLIISRTPVRISFFGGGTDYPSFFQKFGGAVLGTTINQFVHISLKTLQHAFFDHNLRIAYSKIEHVRSIDHIQHPSIRESLKYKGIEGNLDIHVFSDLPARTGLGSSSAFTVGFLNALSALQGKIVSKQKLAEEACHVEQNLIQENVGSQDCFHASFGGWNLIEFYSQSVRVKPVVSY